jgi:hypothetical protein
MSTNNRLINYPTSFGETVLIRYSSGSLYCKVDSEAEHVIASIPEDNFTFMERADGAWVIDYQTLGDTHTQIVSKDRGVTWL